MKISNEAFERLRNEAMDLRLKIGSLEALFRSKEYHLLADIERNLLSSQHITMRNYEAILTQRIIFIEDKIFGDNE